MLSIPITTLPNGVQIPQLGLGTSHNGGYSEAALLHGLQLGLRHVDTAQRYGTEAAVGSCVAQLQLERDQLFLTSKLWPASYGQITEATRRSLTNLQTDYLDLYLLHWPQSFDGASISETWRSMELLLESGKARSIGVSNFLERHLDPLLEEASVIPHVNQVEFHPFQQNRSLVKYCHGHNICVEGWSPLAKGAVIGNKTIKTIAEAKGVTEAQVAIRWSLQSGIITIPKSTKINRLDQNCDVFGFELSSDEMQKMSTLDCDMRVSWDPRTVV